ncbi:PLP-dependent aminotransferase family protein [Vibrio sp. T187]|uniref:aminotransferase-like domain-containing protein n=1 Tax=Vibrio TaxID=662 RepID=UPI0010C9B79E|nr:MULTISPECIES: PLP-dependent aminotransferase family protein [Vibrio]MBW3697370.1 PLP-dependent aminotransferase family protein [Vibrio sp. T187]
MTIQDMSLCKQSNAPLYKQIADQLSKQIDHGDLKANQKLPTHRKLADQLGVTVGTITRAYAEAERRGLIEARVGSGTFVTDKQKTSWVFEESVASRDECNFGYNIPPQIERSDMLTQAMAKLSQSPSVLNQLMMYQSPNGIESHRQQVCSWLASKSVHLNSDQLLFSSGAQHGIQMVIDTFTRAGDTLFVEKYTYPGLLSLARQKQLSVKGIEMDEEGVIPESLVSACKQNQARFIYLTPTFQNPTTAIMSLERRQAIIEVCKRHDLLIIEDDINGLLAENVNPPLVNLAPEQVIHIGAFSKILAPGLRVGYVHAPTPLYQPLVATLQNHSWMISPLLTALVCELTENGAADEVLMDIRQQISQRLETSLEYLAPFEPIFKKDCFHIWLPIPEQWRMSDFVVAAEKQGVTVKSGELFSPPAGSISPHVRLALSSPIDQAQLIHGLTKLQTLLNTDPLTEFAL